MRHLPVALLGVFAVIAVIVMLFSVVFAPDFGPLAFQYIGGSSPSSANTVIVSLDIGEYLSNEVTGLGESQLGGLRGGTISGKDFSSTFTQSLRFGEPGLFNGCRVVFGRDEQNRVADYLECSDSLFKYMIDFSPGLSSRVDGGSLPGIEDETITMLGDTFTVVDTYVNTGNKDISIKMFGGYGTIELRDTNYGDDLFTDGGAKVNGKTVSARVKIKASLIDDELSVYSIHYLLDADAVVGGSVQILPLHCSREYLQYPLGLLSTNFDICYKGISGAVASPSVSGVSGNEVQVKPAGNDEYVMNAQNLQGRLYQIPLAQLPGMYGNKGRNFVFVEAPNIGAPNINVNDYVLVASRNDVQGVSNVLMYKGVIADVAYFTDLSSGQRSAPVDAAGDGQLMIGEGTYEFRVGAGGSIAMDQNNDGNINGGEANFVLSGGTRIDFGPGFTVRVITPQRLFYDPPGADEVTRFDIVFGGDIDLNVPSPQNTVPGYTFQLYGEGGGISKGMTKYGILFTLDTNNEPSRLGLVVPGAAVRGTVKGGTAAEVYITLERPKMMKQPQAPAPTAVCGDGIIVPPELCDPPGSACVDLFKRKGVCGADCISCLIAIDPVCGNKLLEPGEQCESSGDCPVGFKCENCNCVALPPAVCGNNLLEVGEQCEADADCPIGYTCSGCACLYSPPVQAPAPVVKPNVFARFFSWLASLFGA